MLKCKAVPVGLRQHPAQKPVELLERLIAKSTDENALVYDPFIGSGATGLAALRQHRQYIGSELSRDYYTIAKNTLVQYAARKIS